MARLDQHREALRTIAASHLLTAQTALDDLAKDLNNGGLTADYLLVQNAGGSVHTALAIIKDLAR